MTFLMEAASDAYTKYFIELSDQRTIDWPLMRSPVPILAIIVTYIWIVKTAGPIFMKNRPPFDIDSVTRIYDTMQALVCTILSICALFWFYGPGGQHNLLCQPLSYSNNMENKISLLFCYSYFAMKLIDLMHTIFYVLRKKYCHITPLHIYHHTTQVLMTWYGMRFVPGGHAVFFGVIDGFLHGAWYTYFLYSIKRRGDRRLALIKQYLSLLTMLEYLAIFLHSFQMLLNPSCDFPKIPVLIFLPNSLLYFYFFSRSYKKLYIDDKYK